MVIQRILRHASVSTSATYYIKTAADDVRNAMTMLEERIAETGQAPSPKLILGNWVVRGAPKVTHPI